MTDDRRRELREAFIEARGFWTPLWEGLLDIDPDFFEAYLSFSSVPWRNGPLEPKVKELVLLAMDAAATHLFEPGIRQHVRNAIGDGATREELMEVLELTSTLGIHACNIGVPILVEELEAAGQPIDRELDERRREVKADFEAKRGYWHPFWDDILALDPEFLAAYTQFSGVPWTHGVLEPKVKEMIYIAFDVAATHLYEPGLRAAHPQRARARGDAGGDHGGHRARECHRDPLLRRRRADPDRGAGRVTVGVVGLGNMGGRIARRLVDGGEDVVGFDLDASRAAGAGARSAASLADVAGAADVVLLSLPDSPAIEAVVDELEDDLRDGHDRRRPQHRGAGLDARHPRAPRRPRRGLPRRWDLGRRRGRGGGHADDHGRRRARGARRGAARARALRRRRAPHGHQRQRPHRQAHQQLPQCHQPRRHRRGDGRWAARPASTCASCWRWSTPAAA